jgi:hypothetical protein
MKILITSSQLSKLNTKNRLVIKVNESQYKKYQKLRLIEDVQLYPFVADIDENTVEVKLVDLTDQSIIKITPESKEENEPSLEDLIGKKRGDIVKIATDDQEKDYTIMTIVNRVTKDNHQNFDDITSIEGLIIKLKSDPYFQRNNYAPKKQTFSVLEKLRKKGESYERRIMQIFYLLFRRSGNIKKFETKLNRFIPFMKC